MKYMTFNSSCSYAGVANMLEQYGIDTDDRTIALGMKLPYLFDRKDGAYRAGPMLQTAQWFNLYLHPIGWEMDERMMPSAQVSQYLRQQKTAMLGLRAYNGKHAVVYTGIQGNSLIFINNKWAHTSVPEVIHLPEDQLLSKLDETVSIATLAPIAPKPADLIGKLTNSVAVIDQNLDDIKRICSTQVTTGFLRLKLDSVFRPLLLDGITMLQLIGEHALAEQFSVLQRSLLTALRQEADTNILLADHLPFEALSTAAQSYIALIRREITKSL